MYGGEYAWDGYTVRLYNQRGQDNGVRIAYGKNLTDLEQDENISSVATGIYPYWADTEGNLVVCDPKIVPAPGSYDLPGWCVLISPRTLKPRQPRRNCRPGQKAMYKRTT